MSNQESTEDRVLGVIADVTGVTRNEIHSDTDLRGDLVPTSLDQVTLFMALSDEFDTEIDEELVQNINSVSELIGFITSRVDA